MISAVAAALAMGLVGPTGNTTIPFDTSGANLIVGVLGFAEATSPAVSDNMGNTYTPLTKYAIATHTACRIWYVLNPVAGPGHTITVGGGGTIYVGALFTAFKGAQISSVFDGESGAAGVMADGTTVPGSATPSRPGCLVVAGVGTDYTASGLVTPSGFNAIASAASNPGNWYGVGSAYRVQTAAAASNPSWTGNGGSNSNAPVQAFFRPAPEPPRSIIVPRGAIHRALVQ